MLCFLLRQDLCGVHVPPPMASLWRPCVHACRHGSLGPDLGLALSHGHGRPWPSIHMTLSHGRPWSKEGKSCMHKAFFSSKRLPRGVSSPLLAMTTSKAEMLRVIQQRVQLGTQYLQEKNSIRYRLSSMAITQSFPKAGLLTSMMRRRKRTLLCLF